MLHPSFLGVLVVLFNWFCASANCLVLIGPKTKFGFYLPIIAALFIVVYLFGETVVCLLSFAGNIFCLLLVINYLE